LLDNWITFIANYIAKINKKNINIITKH